MKLSKREKILISMLIGIALIGAYFFYLFLPKYQGYVENREKLQQDKILLGSLKELRSTQELREEEQEIRLEMVDSDEMLPNSMNLPILFRDLLQMRDYSNIQYQTLDFKVADKASDKIYDNGTYLAKVNISMVLSGTYEDINQYLKSLYESQRKLVISMISYRTVEDKLEVSLVANAFALVKEGVPQEMEYNFTSGKVYGKQNPFIN